jgi:hypothetical protein
VDDVGDVGEAGARMGVPRKSGVTFTCRPSIPPSSFLPNNASLLNNRFSLGYGHFSILELRPLRARKSKRRDHDQHDNDFEQAQARGAVFSHLFFSGYGFSRGATRRRGRKVHATRHANRRAKALDAVK